MQINTRDLRAHPCPGGLLFCPLRPSDTYPKGTLSPKYDIESPSGFIQSKHCRIWGRLGGGWLIRRQRLAFLFHFLLLLHPIRNFQLVAELLGVQAVVMSALAQQFAVRALLR